MDKKVDIIVNILEKINAKDISIYDTKDMTPFFEYMIVSTVASSRQLSALGGYLKEEAAKSDFEIKGLEGANSDEWVLADLGNVLVNAFTKDARERFDLDRLWKKLPRNKKEEKNE